MKKLILRELVHALNEVVSTSESIAKVVRKANAAGFSISLSLDGRFPRTQGRITGCGQCTWEQNLKRPAKTVPK
jgi:hypothetical protein